MGSGAVVKKSPPHACTAKKGLGCIVAFIMCGLPLLVVGITLTILYFDRNYGLGVGGVAMITIAGIALIATLVIAMMSLRRTHERLRKVLRSKKQPLGEEVKTGDTTVTYPVNGVNTAYHSEEEEVGFGDVSVVHPLNEVNSSNHSEESTRRESEQSTRVTVDVEHIPSDKEDLETSQRL